MEDYNIEDFENKKIRVKLNNHELVFKVTKVIKLTHSHIVFLDKFFEKRMFNYDQIKEILP